MAIYERIRKPFIARFFIALFIIILTLAILLGGLWGFLYLSKNVDCISALSQIKSLNQSFEVEQIVNNAPTEPDIETMNTKATNTSLTSTGIAIKDTEFCSYLNNEILDGQVILTTNTGTLNAKSVNMEVLQVTFNVPNALGTTLTDINVVLKLETTTFKNQISSFPFTLLRDQIPNVLYFTINGRINSQSSTTNAYSIVPTGLYINSLSASETANIINFFDLSANWGGATYINQQLASLIVDNLIGSIDNPGLFYSYIAPQNCQTSFSFVSNGTTGSLQIDVNTIKQITYLDTKNCQNSNPSTYVNSDGIITLTDLNKKGYTFKGWFTGANGTGTQITQLSSSTPDTYSLYAKWVAITCEIEYYNIKDTTQNKTSYDIETETFVLNNPKDEENNEFIGWTGSGITELTKTVTIKQGTFGDLAFFAHYKNDEPTQYSVILKANNSSSWVIKMYQGTILDLATISTFFTENNIINPGYSINEWYTDSEQKNLFTSTQISNNLTLYGTWEYFTNNILFYPYLTEFNSAVTNNSVMTFDSQEKLLAWIDYVAFYHITYDEISSNIYETHPTFTLTYIGQNISSSKAREEARQQEVANAYAIWKQTVNYQTVASSIVIANNAFFYNKNSAYQISDLAKNVADNNKSYTYPQIENALALQNTNTRDENYNNFAVNNLKLIKNVSNTEQLVRVLEQGYQPSCKANSSAERIYNKAKDVLRQICNDTMTDAQKTQAIYEWLCTNVAYDNYAVANITNPNQTRTYNSWFCEGVFDTGIAVCEGYAKAAVVMLRLEGIPAVVVNGNSHAWNKVLVDGNWFEFDATHGNPSANKTEIVTYTKFLFDSSFRDDYKAEEYTNLICETKYDYYSNATYVYDEQEFDLCIDSQTELELALGYAKTHATETKFSLEFTTTLQNINSIINQVISSQNLSLNKTYTQTDCNGNTTYILVCKNK